MENYAFICIFFEYNTIMKFEVDSVSSGYLYSIELETLDEFLKWVEKRTDEVIISKGEGQDIGCLLIYDDYLE